MTEKTRRVCINALIERGYVEVKKPANRAAQDESKRQNTYKVIRKGTFNMGYTLCSRGAIEGCIDRKITPTQLKIYLALLKYAYGKGRAFPSLPKIAEDVGAESSQYISREIKELERKRYLRIIEVKKGRCKRYQFELRM